MIAPALEIVRAGLCTTVQDLGRPGQGRFGVSPSGAMDPWAHRLANRLLANAEGAAALELTGAGVELVFLIDCPFALAGADLGAELDGVAVPPVARALARAGTRLRFLERRQGARATLALAGGLAVDAAAAVFGSVATDVGGGLGGLDGAGRPLRAGQRLACTSSNAPGPAWSPAQTQAARQAWQAVAGQPAGTAAVLRFVPEPEAGVPSAVQQAFAGRRFRLSSRAGRTGYRFEGEPLPVPADPDRLSEPTAPGAIQLPPDGLPILLMADRNTTGGYPRLGHLCSADVSRAAQLWPGDELMFQPITAAEAASALQAAEARLRAG